jgi:recombination protein RecA
MSAANLLRDRLEAALARRIPGALSPQPRIVWEFVPTGIRSVDEFLHGGFPASAITEIVGTECSGRTSLALSFLSGLTHAGKVCAWVDVSDALHPESAAAAGVDLQRLLWVRCGVAPTTSTIPHPAVISEAISRSTVTLPEKYFVPRPVVKGLHGGGFGPHPRGEVKGLSNAIAGLLREDDREAPRHGTYKQQKSEREKKESGESYNFLAPRKTVAPKKPWSRLDQALRTTDLLLQNGGFAAIVLDMGDIAPVQALRVPLATWFRYRAVAAQKQTSIVLLLQHPCAKSSAALTLRLHAGGPRNESTVFAGLDFLAEVERQRFSPGPEEIRMLRKPPQTQRWARCQNRTAWTGR